MNNEKLIILFLIILIFICCFQLDSRFRVIEDNEIKITTLETDIDELQLDRDKLRIIINELEVENDKLKSEISKRERVVNSTSRGQVLSVPDHDEIKTVMDWRKITNVNSEQYKLQRQENVYTEKETGLRKIGDKFIVALGYGYGEYIGQEFEITMENGFVFGAILGDFKAKKDTDPTNRVHNDGSIIEFIVEQDLLEKAIKLNNVQNSTVYNFKGKVKSIKRME